MRKLGLAALLALTATVLRAEWPTVETAGFRHCALIYELPSRNKDDFKPMLAYRTPEGVYDKNRQLFDAFLFLTQVVDGAKTQDGETTMRHWRKLMDNWFRAGADVPALHAALTELDREPGGPPRRPIKVIFCIPWLSPAVTDFGDVDGDGKSENLANKSEVDKVLRWFLGELETRLKAYPELELWGLYWMREDVEHDAANLRIAADILHGKNLKFLWIPYFRAANWDRWREFGFDVAIMQSNYAFTSKLSGGNSRRNRLDVTADLCKAHGMGVEIEFPYGMSEPERRIVLETYAAGSRHGFQFVPTAYFFSYRFEQYRSADPAVRDIYEQTADYIEGKIIELPAEDRWTVRLDAAGLTATAAFDPPRRIGGVDLFLEETPARFWRGVIAVEARNGEDEPWRTIGWQYRGNRLPSDGRHQLVHVEAFAEAKEFRLTMHAAADSPAPALTGVAADFTDRAPVVGAAFRLPYRSTLPPARVFYADSDRGDRLTDGVTGGPWKAFVGWHNGPIGIQLDLGASPPVYDEIRVYARSEPDKAIRWPDGLFAVTAPDGPPGLDRAPELRFAPVPADGPLAIKRLAPGIEEGFYACRFPARADRFLRIGGEASAWGFLAEIELRRDGRKIETPRPRYRLTTPQKVKADSLRRDDGFKLTDGRLEDKPENAVAELPAGETAAIMLRPPGPVGAVEVVCGAIANPADADARVSARSGAGAAVPARLIRRADGFRAYRVEFPAPADGELTIHLTAGKKMLAITEVLID